MGNACGKSTVNKIVTVGGRRHKDRSPAKPYKIKVKPKEKVSSPETKKKRTKQNREKEALESPKVKVSSERPPRPSPNLSSPVVRPQEKTELGKENTNSKALSKNIEDTDVTKSTKTGQNQAETSTNNKKRSNDRHYFSDTSSSEFSINCGSSSSNRLLSRTQLQSEKFRVEWKREEKRLQMEYCKAEEGIRNSQQDELRAKAQAQTWREKLEKLTVMHRKHLFKQAQSLHSRLHSAEKLLTFHEVRAKKLQIKNDSMKDLINTVKEEAKNLRVESEKRRKFTQQIFDEKFSTVENQLTKLKHKLGQTEVNNPSTSCAGAKPPDKTLIPPWECTENKRLIRAQYSPNELLFCGENDSRYFYKPKCFCEKLPRPPSLSIKPSICHPHRSPIYSSSSSYKTPSSVISTNTFPNVSKTTNMRVINSPYSFQGEKQSAESGTQLRKHIPRETFKTSRCTQTHKFQPRQPKSGSNLDNEHNFSHNVDSSNRQTASTSGFNILQPNVKCTSSNSRSLPSGHLLQNSQRPSSIRLKSRHSSGSSILVRLFNMNHSDSERSSVLSLNSVKFFSSPNDEISPLLNKPT